MHQTTQIPKCLAPLSTKTPARRPQRLPIAVTLYNDIECRQVINSWVRIQRYVTAFFDCDLLSLKVCDMWHSVWTRLSLRLKITWFPILHLQ